MTRSLRDALAAKRVRETTYLLAVEDDAEPRKLRDEAKSRRLMLGIGKVSDEEAVTRADAELESAEEALAACYYPLRLRGIPPAELEALRASHPAKDENDEIDFDADSFRPALVAACAVDSDLTPAEWRVELESARWTLGDVNALYQSALVVCNRPVNEGAVKG